jgi:hypothetical protein
MMKEIIGEAKNFEATEPKKQSDNASVDLFSGRKDIMGDEEEIDDDLPF